MRKIIVSNRLPFSASKDEKSGEVVFNETAGGLVSGLSAYLDSMKGAVSGDKSIIEGGFLWIGWPGSTGEKSLEETVRRRAAERFSARPVFIDEETMNKFYHGFCNKTIWPLFHYFPSYVGYEEDYWESYKAVNEMFAEAVLEEISDGDVVWVHDYHLMLLPKLLRDKLSSSHKLSSCPTVSFFLHIPFPSYEIFRILPDRCRKEILEGLLGADLVGFHTQEYTQYFLRCVMRILGFEHNAGIIALPDSRSVKADTFPMGIDYEKYHLAATKNVSVELEKNEIKRNLAGQKVILSIDRLDYTKGIVNRLRAYEIFLKNNPSWKGKVALLMVLVPSRVGVEDYQEMKKQIDELVGKINGAYGDVGWTPVIYQYRYLPFVNLAALYALSDVCLVTPLRDGMNLVAKEYIASRPDGGGEGVLILSEMAGASKELGEAVIVNPYDVEDMSNAILKAVEMPSEEQIKRNEAMKKRIARYDVKRWAEEFVDAAVSFASSQKEKADSKIFSPGRREYVAKKFRAAAARIIFLDYDGTVVPFSPYPWEASPDKELLSLLGKLSSGGGSRGQYATSVFIVSGRDRDTLERWFGGLNIGLVAEHGVWIRKSPSEKRGWVLSKPVAGTWKKGVLPLLERYSDRLPGSFIEEKDYSISFHYRRADVELGAVRAKELMDDLIHFTANMDVQVFQGNKVVEIRESGINKGFAVLSILKEKEGDGGYDFALAMGDDWTDEDMFKALAAAPPSLCREKLSIKVGPAENPTAADYTIRDYRDARGFLSGDVCSPPAAEKNNGGKFQD